jgi:CHAD domain-containing protein
MWTEFVPISIAATRIELEPPVHPPNLNTSAAARPAKRELLASEYSRFVAVEMVLRQRIDALIAALPQARAGEVDGVHHARVATRRLRAVLPLLDPRISRKLVRAMRRLTRVLGPVRDLDVTLAIIGDLERARELPRAAAATLRQSVVDERRHLRDAMIREIDRTDLQKIEKKVLAAVHEHSAGATRADAAARLPDARARAARRAARLRDAIESAASLYLPDRLHEVRIAVKKLRYSLEVVRELRRSRATARIRTLKRAQDLLGRMHDLEVLIARTRAVQGSSSAPDLRVSANLDRLVRQLETECRQLHGHYMAARPSLLSICEYAIGDAEGHRRSAA